MRNSIRVLSRTAVATLLIVAALPAASVSAAARAASDVTVTVRRGDLVITATRLFRKNLNIVPTATGLRIESPDERATINGSSEAFETDEVTRDWKFDFTRATARLPRGSAVMSVTVEAPADGAPRPRPRNVVFAGTGVLSLSGIDVLGKVVMRTGAAASSLEILDSTVRKDVRFDGRRGRESVFVRVRDSSIGGSLAVRSGVARTRVRLSLTQVGGATRIFVRNFGKRATELSAEFDMFSNDLASLVMRIDLRTRGETADMSSDGNRVRGDVALSGDLDLSSRGDSIGGTLSMVGGNRSAVFRGFSGLTVEGDLALRAGSLATAFRFDDSDLGELVFHGSPRSDFLGTVNCTLRDGGRYIAGRGKKDRWITTGDGLELETRSVENVQAFFVPPPTQPR